MARWVGEQRAVSMVARGLPGGVQDVGDAKLPQRIYIHRRFLRRASGATKYEPATPHLSRPAQAFEGRRLLTAEKISVFVASSENSRLPHK